jgi:hypothetical protein
VTLRCQICGCSGARFVNCVKRLPEEIESLVPTHCERCHWEARAVAEAHFCGPILPAPYGRPETPLSTWVPLKGVPLPDPGESPLYERFPKPRKG